MTTIETLKQDLKKAKPYYGVDITLKKLRTGAVKKVYMASNCPEKDTIKRYASMTDTEVLELTENNVELGVICKRPHSVSVLSFA